MSFHPEYNAMDDAVMVSRCEWINYRLHELRHNQWQVAHDCYW